MKFGKNGYPVMTPGMMWLAISVYRENLLVPAYTDIYPSHDDPLFQFRDLTNSPWLARADIDAINALHRKLNVHRRSVMVEYDHSYWNPLHEEERRALRREPVLRRKYETPTESFEIDEGGWLLTGGLISGSQTAADLEERQRCKASRDYETADLIRRTVEFGGVEVRDLPNGTLWFFA